MKLIIKNCKDKEKKKILEHGAHFFVSRLLSPKIAKNIILTIKFMKKIDGRIDEEGICEVVCEKRIPREFEIKILSHLDLDETLEVIAHEIVHLKQYATQELKFSVLYNMYKWNGEFISQDEVDYWECPWEIDAYGRSVGLVYKFSEKYFNEKENAYEL